MKLQLKPKSFWIACLLLLTTGCTSVGIKDVSVIKFNDTLDKLVCKKDLIEVTVQDVDGCVKRYQGEGHDEVFNRVYRAFMLLELSTRYGVARIKSYSQDSENDARRLLLSVKDAHAKILDLKINYLDNKSSNPRYYIDRTDVVISLLNVVNNATKSLRVSIADGVSTNLGLANFLANNGEKVLLNLLEDRLYAGAYATTLYKSTFQQSNDALKAKLWDDTEKAYKKQCLKLAKLAEQDDDKSICE